MKLIQKTKLITLALLAVLALSACESSKAGNTSDQTNYILLNLLNRTTENAQARLYCQEAVYYMNQCIGASTGFNPAVMCSDANLVAGVAPATTEDNYKALSACVKTQVVATNCNFPQNRVAHPVQAKANFFSSCDAPSGMIVTVY